MSPYAEPNCGTCRFYRWEACHRFPPTQAPGEPTAHAPHVRQGGWCGEHQPEPAPTVNCVHCGKAFAPLDGHSCTARAKRWPNFMGW